MDLDDIKQILELVREHDLAEFELERDIERTRSGLRGTFVLMGSVAVVLVGISLALWLGSRARRE